MKMIYRKILTCLTGGLCLFNNFLDAKIVVLTWYWSNGEHSKFSADDVNGWAEAVRDHTTIDIEIACVTNEPKGISDWIRIIPSPQLFEDVHTELWDASKGHPQCFRRLALFHRNAEKIFGGDRIISMDLDCLITDNLDDLFSIEDPIAIAGMGTNDPRLSNYKRKYRKQPFNGSYLSIKAGARPDVCDDFCLQEYQKAVEIFGPQGSDQLWLSYKLSQTEVRIVGQPEGVFGIGHHLLHVYKRLGHDCYFDEVLDKSCICFSAGRTNLIANQSEEDIKAHGLKKYYLFKKSFSRTPAGVIKVLDDKLGAILCNSGICIGPMYKGMGRQLQTNRSTGDEIKSVR